MNSALAGQLRLFQLRVVSGRIVASSPISQQNLTSTYPGKQFRERLSIDLNGGAPNVSYERVGSEERISYDILRGRRVVIEQLPKSTLEHAAVKFEQPDEGPLTLTVATGSQSKTYRASTLWHLLLIEPEVTREYLVPLVQIMRPGWQLTQQAQSIEEALCRAETSYSNVDRAGWQRELSLLGSPRYVDRERAEQHLREAGPVALPFLRMQLAGRLDPEQAFRVRRVVRSLAGDIDEDNPDRVTPWLMGDPRVWYEMLDRDSVEVRTIAARQLSRALAAEVDFDPHASVRDRQRQLAALAERFADLLGPLPAPVPRDEDR